MKKQKRIDQDRANISAMNRSNCTIHVLILLINQVILKLCKSSNVRNNGGNCMRVKSCRPSCLTFRVHRHITDCKIKGYFNKNRLYYDTDRFNFLNCRKSNKCINGLCGRILPVSQRMYQIFTSLR